MIKSCGSPIPYLVDSFLKNRIDVNFDQSSVLVKEYRRECVTGALLASFNNTGLVLDLSLFHPFHISRTAFSFFLSFFSHKHFLSFSMFCIFL